jgi:hypothetical protein
MTVTYDDKTMNITVRSNGPNGRPGDVDDLVGTF